VTSSYSRETNVQVSPHVPKCQKMKMAQLFNICLYFICNWTH